MLEFNQIGIVIPVEFRHCGADGKDKHIALLGEIVENGQPRHGVGMFHPGNRHHAAPAVQHIGNGETPDETLVRDGVGDVGGGFRGDLQRAAKITKAIENLHVQNGIVPRKVT